jgi:hypothetical protein
MTLYVNNGLAPPRSRWWLPGAVVISLLGATAAGYRLARAGSAPRAEPLSYSGTIEESGQLVDGTRDFTLFLWSDASSSEDKHRRCTTKAPGVPVTRGRFRIAIDNRCTAAVRANEDLWIEVQVANLSLGRRKISAAP